jgi:gamma-glutamyltranspeptidase/glutathione hydrolase
VTQPVLGSPRTPVDPGDGRSVLVEVRQPLPQVRQAAGQAPELLEVQGRQRGQPILAAGGSGGRRIMAAVTQMLTFVTDFAMTPAEAAHHPRIDVSDAETVHADRRLSAAALAALAEAGPVEIVEHAVLPINFACPNLIEVKQDGTRTGISDVQSPWSAALAQR